VNLKGGYYESSNSCRAWNRIQGLTQGSPKCLLPFGDRTILDFQLDSLFQAGISEVAIVVGHAEREIVDHVARRRSSNSLVLLSQILSMPARTTSILSRWQKNGSATTLFVSTPMSVSPWDPAPRSSHLIRLIDHCGLGFREETQR
jgi:hypothetical protein